MSVVILSVLAASIGQPAAPTWHSDFTAARIEATKSGKPIFAVLH